MCGKISKEGASRLLERNSTLWRTLSNVWYHVCAAEQGIVFSNFASETVQSFILLNFEWVLVIKPSQIQVVYKFRDTINPLCPSNDGIESTKHFLLLCLSFEVQRRKLLGGVYALLRPVGYIDRLEEV